MPHTKKTKKTTRGYVQGSGRGRAARALLRARRKAEPAGKTKHGVMCVIFAERAGARQFLLLHRVLNWSGWEFVKGGIDKGETAEEAGRREIKEEAGLKKLELIGALEGKHGWDAKGAHYDYSVLLFRADMGEKVKLQAYPVKEHDKFGWVAQGKVRGMLEYENTRAAFAKALGQLQ